MRRTTGSLLLVAFLAGAFAACHLDRPVVGGTKLTVGGTIAGTVSASGGSPALASRKVTAVNVATNARYDTTTAANGGYTIKVPEGTYRIEVELRAGETLAKHPDDTHVNNGDLDAGRDFVVTIK